MCQHVMRGGDRFSTPRQLSKLVGGTAILEWKEHEEQMDWCLCTIDVGSTLNRAGLKWRHDADPMIFLIDE